MESVKSAFYLQKRIKSAKNTKFICPLLDISVSGSSIIQDGKLVGAVTHALVNDPTTGHGRFIENMLEAAAYRNDAGIVSYAQHREYS